MLVKLQNKCLQVRLERSVTPEVRNRNFHRNEFTGHGLDRRSLCWLLYFGLGGEATARDLEHAQGRAGNTGALAHGDQETAKNPPVVWSVPLWL